jgi:hypothetical protein
MLNNPEIAIALHMSGSPSKFQVIGCQARKGCWMASSTTGHVWFAPELSEEVRLADRASIATNGAFSLRSAHELRIHYQVKLIHSQE